ncbi:MAG: molybdenum ABC transporter ATP-binding protein [Planctomycetia bacterium]|nr:MAG: molybdenum ABC transporter ATP-binding protein [Planctomycetia bacterium]
MSELLVECKHRYASGFELDVHFQTGDGITALFGPSGSGKSTTLLLVAGLLRPQSGRIRLGEHLLMDTATGTFVPPERRQIGFVFQDHLLFPHLSVRNNLRYGARRRPARPTDFGHVVEILELESLLDRYPQTLSGGQRQRAALGRAILRGPRLLLMDEPLTALDQGLKERILTYLERIVAEYRIPTVFVSHDQADVRRVADHVVVLEAGHTVDAGPTRATLDEAVTRKMQSHPGPINLLRVDDLEQINGHWEGHINGHRFRLPSSLTVTGPSHYVQFAARDVVLAEHDVQGLSARNHVSGRVRQVVPLADRAFVAVDVGQFLWTEVTLDAVRELALRPDAEVTCLIKTAAVRSAE